MPFLAYPPQNTTEAIAVLNQDIQIAHDVVHGDENDEVLTENGLVPSFSKVIKTLNSASLLVSTMKMTDIGLTSFSVSSEDHIKHFCCDNTNDITVTINTSTKDGEPIKGIMIFFTQISDGVVNLIPASGVTLIYPENSSPITFGKGATIGIESRSETEWIVTGNLGY